MQVIVAITLQLYMGIRIFTIHSGWLSLLSLLSEKKL